MSPRAKPKLLDWLTRNGALIDRDAAVSIIPAKSGLTITFTWSFDGKRDLRLTFSGVTPDERKVAMIAWLNGEFHRPLSSQGATP